MTLINVFQGSSGLGRNRAAIRFGTRAVSPWRRSPCLWNAV